MSGQRHPDTEELASLRAGIASGLHGRRLASHVAHCARCASVSEQLGEVSSVLASVPALTLPDAFESRITAALAAEAATRATTAAAEHASGAGSADRVPAHRRPRSARSRGRQLSLRFHPAMGAALVVVCLIAGFGYLVTRSSSSSSSSSFALSEPAASSSAEASGKAAAEPSAVPSAPASVEEGARKAANGHEVPFTVVMSGRHYAAAGLAAQVQGELRQVHALQNGPGGSTASAVPSPASTSVYSAGIPDGTAPPSALIGCVQHLTGNAPLDLVERASYQGRHVYVIATATRAWVVGLGCTAGNSEVIATVTLSAP